MKDLGLLPQQAECGCPVFTLAQVQDMWFCCSQTSQPLGSPFLLKGLVQGMLDQDCDAFVDLLCNPALTRATAHDSAGVAGLVRKLLDYQDQHDCGAAAALTVPPSLLIYICREGCNLHDACLLQLAAVKPPAPLTCSPVEMSYIHLS